MLAQNAQGVPLRSQLVLRPVAQPSRTSQAHPALRDLARSAHIPNLLSIAFRCMQLPGMPREVGLQHSVVVMRSSYPTEWSDGVLTCSGLS